MDTFNEDPKPGRLVLPLVLIGMIATTYTFINRVATNNDLEIEPSVEQVVVEPDEEPVSEDTTTTTTTTLPGEVVTYLEEISSEKIQSIDLATKVLEANDKWDNEDTTYQEAKDEFANFINDAQQFVETVSEPGPPSTFAGLVKSHEELKSLADLIFADTEELLEGLTSSDTGERRSADINSFNNEKFKIQDLESFDPSNVDVSIFSAGSSVAKKYAQSFIDSGGYVIDLSSEFRYDDDKLLIIPEVNGNLISNLNKPSIIANPNCSTSQLLMILQPIHKKFEIEFVNIATYQALSRTGKAWLL